MKEPFHSSNIGILWLVLIVTGDIFFYSNWAEIQKEPGLMRAICLNNFLTEL